MKYVFFTVFFLFLAAFAQADEESFYCDDEILQWQQICSELEILPEEECNIEDICLVLEEDDAQENVLKGARVEVPEDTPEGFDEQIYIIP